MPTADRTITLYVKPHVYKYLIHENNFGGREVEARKNNRYWYIFYPQLTKMKLDEEITRTELPEWYIRSTHAIKVKTTFDFPDEIVDDATLIEIANMLEELFIEGMFHFVNGRIDANRSIKDSAERFLAMYGISDEEFKLDTALKNLQRLKNRHRQQLLQRRKMSRQQAS